MARHFQYKVEVIFKEIILDGSLRKTKYDAIHIEFQERGSPYVHSFIWILNAPNIQNETAYIGFIEKTIKAQLPNHLKDPELFELVKTYQVHAHSRTCWKYNKNKCHFSYGGYFTEKTIIGKQLDPKLSNDEKEDALTWRDTLLKQVESYIDNNLNPAKVNVIDPTKDNFTQPLSVQEILYKLEIAKVDYDKALSISKDGDLELHLKNQPNFCFVNNYFDVGLKAWQAIMDIQPVFNEYNAVTYMCQYFSKTEDQCSQVIKQAVKEAFENHMHYHGIMKTISRAYLSNRDCSVQEAVYHIFPKLKLRRIFPNVYFVNTNLPEERVQVLLPEKVLSKLPNNSPNIFKRPNIDRYMERPSATFCNGKFSVLNDFCYAEFFAYYTLENKSNQTCEYQPDEFHAPNKLLSPDKFAHHVLLLFYPFRDEKELLSGFPPIYQNKLQEEGV